MAPSSAIQQTLSGVLLQTDMIVTLRVKLGWRADFASIGNTRVQLRAVPSDVVLVGTLVTSADLGRGTFTEIELVITVPSLVNGQAASVGIFYEGRTGQVNVDDVRVLLTPP